jgi:hypothetical protein
MEPPSGRGGDRRSPLAVLEQEAAEIYVEAQAVSRRIKTDRAFTTAHQRVALAGLRDQCLGVAALLALIGAQKEST